MGSLKLVRAISPTAVRPRMQSPEISISHHFFDIDQSRGRAWWLLCQPSPQVSTAIRTLFVESSRVS